MYAAKSPERRGFGRGSVLGLLVVALAMACLVVTWAAPQFSEPQLGELQLNDSQPADSQEMAAGNLGGRSLGDSHADLTIRVAGTEWGREHDDLQRGRAGCTRTSGVVLITSCECVDLGLVAPGASEREMVWLANRSDQVVEIGRIWTSCECLHGWVSRERLAPSERLPLLIWLQSTDDRVRLAMELEVRDKNDGCLVQIPVHAEITPDAVDVDALATAIDGPGIDLDTNGIRVRTLVPHRAPN